MAKLIQHWITQQAESYPDKTAIVWKNQRLSYGDLEAQTNRLAELLKESGCNRGDRICFCVPKSPEAIIAMVASLKADCIYVPVDADCPASRVGKVIESCRPSWMLADRSSVKLVDDALADVSSAGSIRVGSLDEEPLRGERFASQFCLGDLESFSAEPLSSQNYSDDPAHILFTSGSTGTPKGVVITHANVISFVEWGVRYFDMTPDDRVSGHAPLHFDLSTFDVYGAFASGAELHPVPPELNLLPHQIAEFIRSEELTQWFSVPSILSYLSRFDAIEYDDFPSLKRLIWCGEVFPTPALMHWMQRLPKVQFTNLYGPTEATIASSYYTVAECPEYETEPIPIGTACDGEELLVLDGDLKPVSPGEVGDLYISGVGLSPGYWRDNERTRAVFLWHPDRSSFSARIYKTGDFARVGHDGLVYFLGRADTQIKCRGYRIELGEIETALGALDFLVESAVVAIDTEGFEGKIICCAYVSSDGEEVTAGRIRKELMKTIPRYMLPARWMDFEELPKNANGKIHRPQLRDLFEEQQGVEHPRTMLSQSQ